MHTILYPVNELKIGGAEQQLLELVRGLDKGQFRPIVAPLYSGGALDAEFRAVPGVEVVDLHRRGKFDPSPLWRIAALLRRRRVAIVQPFLSPATFFGLLPALLVGAPVKVVTERCGVRRARGFGYKMYRTIEDWLSRYADIIVPNSMAGQDLLVERGLPSSKMRVIYNGINSERLKVDQGLAAHYRAQLNVPHDGAVVGILASLTAPKGHDTLLYALALLRERRPGLRCAIVGDGALRVRLEALADDLGLAQQVRFFGYQRGVANFLGMCDVVVSASRDNEGCSNSILEAMALGVPVIATDLGGNRELVENLQTGFLIPVGDHRALAQAVERVLDDPVRTRVIAERARAMVGAGFGLARMVSDYEELYQQLLQVQQLPTHTPGTTYRESGPEISRAHDTV